MGKHAANRRLRAALKARAKTMARPKTDSFQYADGDGGSAQGCQAHRAGRGPPSICRADRQETAG